MSTKRAPKRESVDIMIILEAVLSYRVVQFVYVLEVDESCDRPAPSAQENWARLVRRLYKYRPRHKSNSRQANSSEPIFSFDHRIKAYGKCHPLSSSLHSAQMDPANLV